MYDGIVTAMYVHICVTQAHLIRIHSAVPKDISRVWWQWPKNMAVSILLRLFLQLNLNCYFFLFLFSMAKTNYAV